MSTPPTATCADGEAALPASGLCPSDAEALIVDVNVGYDRSALTEMTDCVWSVNETPFPAGDVLLYRAASCGGTTARLGLAPGAQRSDLYVETAAVGVAGEDVLVGFVLGSDPDDPTGNILAVVRRDLEAEGAAPAYVASCEVLAAPGRPDAYVVDVRDAAPSPDGPRADCGRYGYTDDGIAFWREAYGFSWFLDLGQDAYHEIDPGSLTLVARGEDGTWGTVGPVVPGPEDNYGVTNVVGMDEEVYGVEAPWTVYAGVDETASTVLYCVAELDGGGLRIGTDGGQWQLGVPHAADLKAGVELDGRVLPLLGMSADGWTFGWLTLAELDAIRRGSVLIIEQGRASMDYDVSAVGPALDAVTACTSELD